LAAAGSILKTLLGATFVVAASGGVAWGARNYVMTSPRFSIQSIVVEGNVRVTPEEIARAGGMNLGDNVFSVDLDASRVRIDDEPWIRSATVTRKLPGTIVVQVTEHEPVALAAVGERMLLVSRTGEIFKELSAEDPFDLPVITGIDPDNVAQDREGAEKKIERARDVSEDNTKAPALSRYPVQEVHLERDGTLSVVVGREAIVIAVGRPPYRGKIEQAERVFAELGKRTADASVIFLDNEASPERVVVRMR
jgi:cell division protein FtsQ